MMTMTKEKLNYLISHARADVNLADMCFQLIKDAPAEEKSSLLRVQYGSDRWQS